MAATKVLLTYKRKRPSSKGLVQGHECYDSLSVAVAPGDTSISRPDLQLCLSDTRASEDYNGNSAVRF